MAKKKVGTSQLVDYNVMLKAGAASAAQPTTNIGFELAKLAGTYVGNAMRKAKTLKNEYPEGITIDKVTEAARPQLVEYLEESKKRFNKAANIVSTFPSWTKKYKNAVEEMNLIKSGYANVEKGLTTLQTNKDNSWKTEPGAGATEFEKARHYDLQNGDVDFYNLEFTDEGVFFTDYESQENSMVAVRKPISQFGPAAAQDNTGSTGQDNLFTNVVNNARNKGRWDESTAINKVNTFLDGMNETQLKNWMFNGNDSYGYHLVANKLGYGIVEIEDDWSEEEKTIAEERNETFKIEMDMMKYSPNLKNQSLRDALYDSLKEAHDLNLPGATTPTPTPTPSEEEDFPLEDDEEKKEVIVKTKGKDVVVKTGDYTSADYEGMNVDQISGLDITRTRAMFKGGNRRIDPEGEGGGFTIFGNQAIRAAGILKALRNLESEYSGRKYINLNINSLADLKRITQLIRKDADFRKKITEAMNALDKKGQRKIEEKYAHKYFVDLQKRWNAEYSERGQETEETEKKKVFDHETNKYIYV
jgi:hypothetical protein